MDLRESELDTLSENIRQLFRLLRSDAKGGLSEAATDFYSQLFSPDLFDCQQKSRLLQIYESFLKDWPGLNDSPIVVLSSLAPGADQLVANVVLEDEFQKQGFYLVAPTSFPVKEFELEQFRYDEQELLPKRWYRDSTSFVPNRQLTDEELQQASAKQEALDKIVNRMPTFPGLPRGFTVILEEDLRHHTRLEFLASCEKELADQAQRRRRYQAAGEYIAAYSHLMLAIWDHIDDSRTSAGTAAIVNARHSGLTRGLLPVASKLPLPLGPTLQLFTRRKERRQANDERVVEWRFRWLMTPQRREDFLELEPDGQSCPRFLEHLESGLQDLLKTAYRLNLFAREENVDGTKAGEHLKSFLSHPAILNQTDQLQNFTDELAQIAPHYFQRIKRIADFRRRATNAQRQKGSKAIANLKVLFLFSLFAALLLDSFNHWHTQRESPHQAHAQHQDLHAVSSQPMADPNVPQVMDPAKFRSELIARLARLFFGVGGVVCAIMALRYFHQQRPLQTEELNHDHRALAEGSRVQMVWFIAGIGRSVSANYMLRQRGEFHWLRQAIRSLAFPYEDIPWHFRNLKRSEQIRLLRCVKHNWLRGHSGNAQSNYFASAQKEQIHDLHSWHKLGSVLVLAGLLLTVGQVLAAVVDFLILGHTFESAAAFVWHWYGCWLLLLPAIVLISLPVKYRSFSRALHRIPALTDDVLKRFVRVREAIAFSHHPSHYSKQLLMNFIAYLAPALILAFFLYLLAVLLSRSQLLPDVSNLTTIVSAIALVCGGLSIAWPEKNLKSELAYQYGTMQQIFTVGANYFETELMKLIELNRLLSDRTVLEFSVRNDNPNVSDVSEFDKLVDEKATILANEFNVTVRQMQDALFELGQEALDENAEWLILHRARPLEPVMAG